MIICIAVKLSNFHYCKTTFYNGSKKLVYFPTKFWAGGQLEKNIEGETRL